MLGRAFFCRRSSPFIPICRTLPNSLERMMSDDIRVIQDKIAALREEMRSTLDRSKQPAIRAQIMEEIGKLKALNGTQE